MEVTFLGYQLLDFVNNENQSVKGIKVYFFFQSDRKNFKGYEVGSYFCDYARDRILYDMVQKLEPLKKYKLELIPSFTGKTKISCFNPV